MSDTRIPLQQAVEQVAAQLGMPRDEVEKLAKRLLSGVPNPQIRPEMLGRVMEVAESSFGQRLLGGPNDLPWSDPAANPLDDVRRVLANVELASRRVLDMSPFVRRTREPGKMPANPNDRRTIRVLGKPYHLAQTKTGLRLQPGESPWQ